MIDKDKRKYVIAYALTVLSPLIMSWAGGNLWNKAAGSLESPDYILGLIMFCLAGTFGTSIGYYFSRIYKYPTIAGLGRSAILLVMVIFALLTRGAKPGTLHAVFFGFSILAIVIWNLADILFLYPNIKKREEEEAEEKERAAK